MAMKTPPEGYHTITPYLTLREVEALVAFVKGVRNSFCLWAVYTVCYINAMHIFLTKNIDI